MAFSLACGPGEFDPLCSCAMCGVAVCSVQFADTRYYCGTCGTWAMWWGANGTRGAALALEHTPPARPHGSLSSEEEGLIAAQFAITAQSNYSHHTHHSSLTRIITIIIIKSNQIIISQAVAPFLSFPFHFLSRAISRSADMNWTLHSDHPPLLSPPLPLHIQFSPFPHPLRVSRV